LPATAPTSRRLRVLTWHVHGSYLWYLSHAPCDFYVPVKPGRPPGYGGVAGWWSWPPSMIEVPADEVASLDVDVVLFQSRQHWEVDQEELLSPAQRRLPRVFLEHDPPRESPTDTRHVVDDPDVTVVHVTHFNDLMWDCGRSPTRVIEHGVVVPDGVRYTGEVERALVVVNGLGRRGRRLGADVVERLRGDVPLDVVGMWSDEVGGLGEVPPPALPGFAARYRVFLNPIRYTSLGLAVCEAMQVGMPIVGLATTEMVTAVEHGVSGYLETDVQRLGQRVRQLLDDPDEARELGRAARRSALVRFGIDRFARDWAELLAEVAGTRPAPVGVAGTPSRNGG